jgi:hypothetical protein
MSATRDAAPEIRTRPLERADLPAVATLFRDALAGGPPRTEPALADFFRRAFFDQPWADSGIPALVAVDDDGAIIGLQGADVRRMQLGDRTLRFAWAGHSVVAPHARPGAVGLFLLRALLAGPQDATVADNAAPLIEQMWLRLGGRRLDLKAIHWVRVFRPCSVAANVVAPRRPRAARAVRQMASALDAALPAPAAAFLAPRAASGAMEELTPRTLLGVVADFDARFGLRPAYDEAYLEWLFAELLRTRERGRLVARLVRGGAGRPLGWFLYYLQPGWRSEVLQIAAPGEREFGTVLDHLLAHAHAHGSAAVRGRLEPGLVEPVVRRRCLLWPRGGTLAHARDPDVLCALGSPRALVTRLDGNDWFGGLPVDRTAHDLVRPDAPATAPDTDRR